MLSPMLIIWSLKRLFDPQSYFWEESEREAEREQPDDSESGDPPGFAVEASDAKPGISGAGFSCRVCGYKSADDAYCPECLADTMQPVS